MKLKYIAYSAASCLSCNLLRASLFSQVSSRALRNYVNQGFPPLHESVTITLYWCPCCLYVEVCGLNRSKMSGNRLLFEEVIVDLRVSGKIEFHLISSFKGVLLKKEVKDLGLTCSHTWPDCFLWFQRFYSSCLTQESFSLNPALEEFQDC